MARKYPHNHGEITQSCRLKPKARIFQHQHYVHVFDWSSEIASLQTAVRGRDTSAVGFYQGPVMAEVTSVSKAPSALAHCYHSCFDDDQHRLDTENLNIPSKTHTTETPSDYNRTKAPTETGGSRAVTVRNQAITHPNSIDLFLPNGCVLF